MFSLSWAAGAGQGRPGRQPGEALGPGKVTLASSPASGWRAAAC